MSRIKWIHIPEADLEVPRNLVARVGKKRKRNRPHKILHIAWQLYWQFFLSLHTQRSRNAQTRSQICGKYKFSHNLDVSGKNKVPALRRWVTAAKAAIPLVKQNARFALSSLARRLIIISKIKCQHILNKISHQIMTPKQLVLVEGRGTSHLSRASLVGFPLLV